MNSFRYQAIEAGGANVSGVIQADDRKSALQLLGQKNLFPSLLETISSGENSAEKSGAAKKAEAHFGRRIKRKDITAFTREISALLAAGIPIPQALDSLGEEEENPALRAVVQEIAEAVRKGESFSTALAQHPKNFGNLYVSMVRVGEEAGVLPKVMNDLAALLEHEGEVRDEVTAAIAYPVFVLGFGIITVTILLTVVLP